MTGGKGRDTVRYLDTMFKNVVIAPAEVATGGMSYFDEKEDVKTPEKLIKAIEQFLRNCAIGRAGPEKGQAQQGILADGLHRPRSVVL